jgi:hypothetical protein
MRNTYVALGSEYQQLASAALLSFGGFIEQIGALWELVGICEESVRPHDEKTVDEILREATEESLAGLDDDVRLRVGEAGHEWIDAVQELQQSEIGVAFGLSHGDEHASHVMARAQSALERLISAYPDLPHAATFLLGQLDAFTTVSRAAVMYESIVMAGVSAFHAQLRALVLTVEHDRRHDLSEAELAGVVDGIVSRGLPRWRAWLADTVHADLKADDAEVAQASEVFLRRNLFVHSGGVVTHRYACAVPDSLPVGRRLSADAAYAHDALRVLLSVGLRFAVTTWAAFRPDFRSGAELLTLFLTQRYLLRVRAWAAIRPVAKWLVEAAVDAQQRDVARVLAALCAKRLGDHVDLHALCGAWDPPQPDLALVRQVLLGEIDAALHGAMRLLAAGQLTRYDLDTWPALDDLRADSRFAALREQRPANGP